MTDYNFNGLGMGLGNLSRLSNAKSRSISAENFSGEKGKGGMDPIRFEEDLRVTIQALGWRSGKRYLPLQDDIASTGFWYQTEPHAPFLSLVYIDMLENI